MGDLIMIFQMKDLMGREVKFFVSGRRVEARRKAFLCPFDACPYGTIGPVDTIDEQTVVRNNLLEHLKKTHTLIETV